MYCTGNFSISDLKMLTHCKKNLHNNKATLNCFIAAIEIPLIHFSDGYLTLDFSIKFRFSEKATKIWRNLLLRFDVL